jgi:N-acetylglucosamine-6-phosphate deacetylase
MSTIAIVGQLVLEDHVARGRLHIADGVITDVEVEAASAASAGAGAGPIIAPGFCDVHVHGFGGGDAAGSRADLDTMARALLRQGVTSFLPTAVSAPLNELAAFAERVRAWTSAAPQDGAEPLGFNMEGPFLSPARRGAHDPRHLLEPAAVPREGLEPLLDGLRVMTVAPELPGAQELIGWLAARGVVVSVGHSAANLEAARRGYTSGARSTTHLFNAMTGLDHRAPGVTAAALTTDDCFVELIADGHHVHPALWPIVLRSKPAGRTLLVSDAISLAGTAATHGTLGGLAVEVHGDRCTLAGTDTLAGSVIALDTAVRHLVRAGTPLSVALAAASRNPLALLGVTDRGRLAPGLRADLVELAPDLRVTRVMKAGEWISVDA